MKNDYRRNTFWIQKNNNKVCYYISIHQIKIEVSKDIYTVCRNSYRKILRDMKRKDCIHYSEIFDLPYLRSGNNLDDIVQQIHKKFLIEKLYQILSQLPSDEKFIINSLYFKDKTERELANLLHVSLSTLHYRKTKILKKMREFFKHDEF